MISVMRLLTFTKVIMSLDWRWHIFYFEINFMVHYKKADPFSKEPKRQLVLRGSLHRFIEVLCDENANDTDYYL